MIILLGWQTLIKKGGILTPMEKERDVAALGSEGVRRGGTWAANGSSPKAGQPSQVVVSVNLKLPPHPREGKTVTLI